MSMFFSGLKDDDNGNDEGSMLFSGAERYEKRQLAMRLARDPDVKGSCDEELDRMIKEFRELYRALATT